MSHVFQADAPAMLPQQMASKGQWAAGHLYEEYGHGFRQPFMPTAAQAWMDARAGTLRGPTPMPVPTAAPSTAASSMYPTGSRTSDDERRALALQAERYMARRAQSRLPPPEPGTVPPAVDDVPEECD